MSTKTFATPILYYYLTPMTYFLNALQSFFPYYFYFFFFFSLQVRTLKTAMSTLCSGKLLDKLRYLFSQLADNNGHMIAERFTAFIRDVGRIASAVGEDRQPIDVSHFWKLKFSSIVFEVKFRLCTEP